MKNDGVDGDEDPLTKSYADPGKDQYKAEIVRIRARRRILETRVPLGTGSKQSTLWGLALSGGGIRSATFCLGVLQAMARAKPPATRAAYSGDATEGHLLPHFDYLSTVSGGGYIGAFFCSLFQSGRLRPDIPRPSQTEATTQQTDAQLAEEASARKAATNAFEVLRFEPPGRIHSGTNYEKKNVGDAPTAWLRENGRYLTSSGAGDLFYGIALAIRNWLSLHFVIGMPILFTLALLNVIQLFMKGHMQEIFGWQTPALLTSLWLLPALVALFCLIPNVLAFWLFYSKKDAETDRPELNNNALKSCVFIMASFGGLVWFLEGALPNKLLWTLQLTIPVMAFAIGWAIWTAYRPPIEPPTVRTFRVKITKRLSQTFQWLLVVGLMVAAFELSHALYQWLSSTSQWWSLSPAAILAGIVWITRKVAGLMDERVGTNPLLKLPLPWLAMILGGAMLCLVVLSWGILLHWLLMEQCLWRCSAIHELGSWILLGIAAVLVVVGGLFIGFLNLSSLQAFYSARLTRAYLGASNGVRFAWSEDEEIRKHKLSVSDPLPGDDLSLKDYYGTHSLAPLHLINVTVNLTSDPVGQLVQRDRKGLPLCIAPGTFATGIPPSVSYRFILDGVPQDRVEKTALLSEADQPLTLGHWIATSGAAFSTGLGRTTSLGTSLVCGLANVRLGTWWPANFVNKNEPEDKRGSRKDPWLAKCLPTPYYLFNEFTATFHGLQGDYQYLSDGGHFENTAAYELLRPGRRLDLIVLCDCGADPEYRFEDLANLIRLARLDLNLEIEADKGYRHHKRFKKLNHVLGIYEDFLTGTVQDDNTSDSKLADDQCALLFNVFNRDEDAKPRKLVCVLLVIKPNIIPRLSDDVRFYSVTHPSFPNEPTIDQFFNEAQFESYRQLGLNTGQLLFGSGRPLQDKKPGEKRESYESLLWAYLEEQLMKIDRSADQNPPMA